MSSNAWESADPSAVVPESPPAVEFGPRDRLPLPGSLPELKSKIDYEALRQSRMAEVNEETRLINLPFGQYDFVPAALPDPGVLAPGIKAWNIDAERRSRWNRASIMMRNDLVESRCAEQRIGG